MSAPIHSSALICKHSLGSLEVAYVCVFPWLFEVAYVCVFPGLFEVAYVCVLPGFLEVVYIMSALSFTGSCAYTLELAFDVGIGFIYNGDSI